MISRFLLPPFPVLGILIEESTDIIDSDSYDFIEWFSATWNATQKDPA